MLIEQKRKQGETRQGQEKLKELRKNKKEEHLYTEERTLEHMFSLLPWTPSVDQNRQLIGLDEGIRSMSRRPR